MLKRFLTCILLFLVSATCAASTTLQLFIWEDYFPEELLTAFENTHGVKIEQVFYETDELKDETLINTKGGQGLDLIVGSRASFREYAKYGWLNKYVDSDYSNLKHIDTQWLPKDQLVGYSLPYLWGTVGIAYRKDKVATTIDSWNDLFKPADELKGRIMMIEDSRDTIGLALKSLGHSINSSDKTELKEAERLLLAQKPFVKSYSYPKLDESAQIVKGDIWVSMIYNGDALLLKEYNNNISFVVPQEGTNLWVDDIAILKQSKNIEAAKTFINFINEPMNAAKIATYLNYASPNKSAHAHLKKGFLEDRRIHPNQSVIDKSEFYTELSPRQLKQRNDIFLKVMK
ncbi:MAG: spermidine/putrescine ABC transporter substrate-binding protein [Pseudomonadales bacterium]|nr:spermidine/putrescine ABC transporter substrate-binding protein [Pseudomonadales bacterium]